MSYFKRPLMGLSGSESPPPAGTKLPECPTNVNGWCSPGPGAAPAYVGIGKATVPESSGSKPSGGGALSEFAKLFGALALSKVGSPQQPNYPGYVTPPQQGISTTTMIIGGGLAVTALVLLLK